MEMTQKPLFVATHPRACSTAFERVFMTRRDILKCVHEPFGDAYYYGPEKLAERYAKDEVQCLKSGFSEYTYRIIMEKINEDNTEGKRLFIKDMAQYFFPPSHRDTAIAPSLLDKHDDEEGEEHHDSGVEGVHEVHETNGTNGINGTNGVHAVNGTNGIHHVNGFNGTNGYHSHKLSNGNHSRKHTPLHTPRHSPKHSPKSSRALSPNSPRGAHFFTQADWEDVQSHSRPASPASPFRTFTELENPTVVPTSLLKQFHFVFLIRHPRYSISSYYRCCIPPLDSMTGFHDFRPDEAGYEELRRFFDYCRLSGQIGPNVAGEKPLVNGVPLDRVDICVLDADDMLDNPSRALEVFCQSTGIDWKESMLEWDNEDDKHFAELQFEKWKGFHEDAIHSNNLHARSKRHIKTDEELYNEWVQKYGQKGADVIKKTVAENVEHYEYLKQFAIKI